MSKFKVQGVGIDTRTMKSSPGVSRIDDEYSYILTSVEANNDYLIRDFVENHVGDPILITSVNFLDSLEVALKDHLENLGKTRINLLLLGPLTDIEKYSENLKNIKTIADHVGLIDPESLDQVKEKTEQLEKLDLKVEFIALPISPLDFNLEILNYCEENKIEVIGLNQMGGYLSAPRNIEAFSVPYLLGFSAFYSDVVILSGRDIFAALDNKWYISELYNTEADPGYILKKSISKPVKELKTAIYTSVSLEGEGSIVPYDDPTMLFIGDGFRFKIGSPLKKMKEYSLLGVGEDEIEILDYVKSLHLPEDGSHSVRSAFIRNKIKNYLESKYSDYTITFLNVGNSALVVSLDKETIVTGAFFWQKITPEVHRQFYLIYPPGTVRDNIVFREFKLSEEEEESMIERQ